MAEEALNDDESRPVIPLPGNSQIGLWLFFGLLIIAGTWLFSVMNAQRQAARAPSTLAPQTGLSQHITSPPKLAIPRDFLDLAEQQVHDAGADQAKQPAPVIPRPPSYRPYVLPPSPPQVTQPPYLLQPERPQVVFDARDPTPAASPTSEMKDGKARVTASRFENPSLTIPQGTVMPAVLETAMDSTHPGGVRALIQRDIHSFDGSRILIQRGSRLYGEYDAQLDRGQKRALIRWTRLIRPDGVTIALDSPASDPLGRTGVKGKVDGKFFQRFGGAILQSILDIGVGVATREATDGVIVALPGSTQNVAQVANPNDVRPTLSVKHGTSVSVFVARDLDFSTVEY